MLLFIPSPPISGWQIGPVFIHIYALCLITGMIAAAVIGNRRWRERGGISEIFENTILIAIPIGIVGARIYHVFTHMGDYFGPGHMNPWAMWEGGIAIYGAVGAGALAALIAANRQGVRFSSLADALAPGIILGQAIGRLGNWFNQELYGLPTTQPWGLEIDAAHRVAGYEQYATFHPTFLYELLWNLLVFGLLLWADKRWALGRGKLFALYVALYTAGRIVTEQVRIDYSYDTFGPIRFNTAAAILFCLIAIAVFLWMLKNKPGREDSVYLSPEWEAKVLAKYAKEAETKAAKAKSSEAKAAVETKTDDEAKSDSATTPGDAKADETEDSAKE